MGRITMIKIENTIAAGETTGTSFSKNIGGRILSVKTVYSNTTPASTSDRDINLFEMNPAAPTTIAKAVQEILNIGTLGAAPEDDNDVYYPRVPSQDNAGTDVTYDGTNEIYEPYIVYGRLMLSVTAAAVGDITTTYIVVEEF